MSSNNTASQSPSPLSATAVAAAAAAAWIEYKKSVDRFTNAKISSDPGYFAKTSAQRHYELCQACPLPNRVINSTTTTTTTTTTNNTMPLLVLPLRIHLIKSPVIGCSDSLNVETSIIPIVQQLNTFWEPQARIRFDLVCAEERECELSSKVQEELKFFLMHKLRRGKDGKMMHKSERRTKFVDVLLTSFNYKGNNDDDDDDAAAAAAEINNNKSYDIWCMDMTGHQSQGICIDRSWRTVLMGERSTKGYDRPTKRPHDCLAKTAAHELGHTLTLGHPKGMKFEDGKSQIRTKHKPNLMSGGADVRGGGGFFLEDWQISAARESAELFLSKTK